MGYYIRHVEYGLKSGMGAGQLCQLGRPGRPCRFFVSGAPPGPDPLASGASARKNHDEVTKMLENAENHYEAASAVQQ